MNPSICVPSSTLPLIESSSVLRGSLVGCGWIDGDGYGGAKRTWDDAKVNVGRRSFGDAAAGGGCRVIPIVSWP